MIILNNQHDKHSREFVSKYGNGNIVYDYPECIDHYQYISSFPSVVIEIPAYYQELIVNEENEIIKESENINKTIEIIGFYEERHNNIDNFYNEISNYIELVNKRAIDFPPK